MNWILSGSKKTLGKRMGLACFIAAIIITTTIPVAISSPLIVDTKENLVGILRINSITNVNSNDTASHGSGGTKGAVLKNMMSGGVNRQYKLYVPVGYDQKTAIPMLIYLHGAGGDYSEGQYSFSDSYVDSKGFIFCTPSANDTEWGPHWWEFTAYHFWGLQVHTDSVFLMEMINKTAQEFNIDYSRIWLTGFSDGGTMTIRFGVSLSHMLSVVCPHSAVWITDIANPANAQRKMPFYARVGDADGSDRITSINDAKTAFNQAGFEFKVDVVPGLGHDWASDSSDKFYDFQSTRILQHNWIRPALSFNSPSPSEKWTAGTMHTINWWLGCGVPPYNVVLELSTNGPTGPFSSIGSLSPSNWGLDHCDWTIPSSTSPTKNAVLRATIHDSSSPSKNNISVMNYTFEITPYPAPEGGVLLASSGFIGVCIVILHIKRKRDETN